MIFAYILERIKHAFAEPDLPRRRPPTTYAWRVRQAGGTKRTRPYIYEQ